MKKEHFNDFTEKNLGKEVIARIKFPKQMIKGKLTKEIDGFCIKNGKTTPIDSISIKEISVVLTKEERQRRKKEKRRSMIMN